jgi:hypothetical protein
MAGPSSHFDRGSLAVIAITLVLFLTALVAKGMTHDILLEAGVFLVSLKLILMAYKNSVTASEMKRELAEIKALLELRSLPPRSA